LKSHIVILMTTSLLVFGFTGCSSENVQKQDAKTTVEALQRLKEAGIDCSSRSERQLIHPDLPSFFCDDFGVYFSISESKAEFRKAMVDFCDPIAPPENNYWIHDNNKVVISDRWLAQTFKFSLSSASELQGALGGSTFTYRQICTRFPSP